MQQKMNKRKIAALLLAAVMMLTAFAAPITVIAVANLEDEDATEVVYELQEEAYGEAYYENDAETDTEEDDLSEPPWDGDENDDENEDENDDAPTEEIYEGYYEDAATPTGWRNVNVRDLPVTGNFNSLRLISVNEGIALAVISQCRECPLGNEFFATSTNMIDWEIRSLAPGWYIYYNGSYYWYVDGLHRTSDWRDDWQFYPSPSEDYEGDSHEWTYIMAHIFDNFESIHEVAFLEEGGVLRVERLPFLVDEEITWVGFVINKDAAGETHRQQLKLFVNGQLLNPLEDDARPHILGLEGAGWAREAVEFMMARDLMDMYMCPETDEPILFNPTGSATRGDVLAAAVKALGLTAPIFLPREHIPFDDVPLEGRGLYIDTARRLGLVAGVGNNNFAPDRTISRQDMMTMLYNILLALGQIQPDYELTSLGRFRDIGQIADYARLPIASLAQAGIIAGDGVNINPRGYMSRVEAAVFVWNLYRMGLE